MFAKVPQYNVTLRTTQVCRRKAVSDHRLARPAPHSLSRPFSVIHNRGRTNTPIPNQTLGSAWPSAEGDSCSPRANYAAATCQEQPPLYSGKKTLDTVPCSLSTTGLRRICPPIWQLALASRLHSLVVLSPASVLVGHAPGHSMNSAYSMIARQ